MENHQIQLKAKVAIVIKALNEEKHIRRSVASAVNAVAPLGGVVVLADSGSHDQTVAIASEYPVTIVQLANRDERCCGIGAQLGYQFTECDYVYILDGDMEIDADFLSQAVAYMETKPMLAGVAGLVEEHGGGNYEFEARKALQDGRVLGEQGSLDMGGLYRGSALRQIGYLTNRNLHSYEEKELGLRLTSAGFTLERIGVAAIKHYGKTENSMNLLWKRWKSHHIDGPGEWIRAMLGKPQCGTICWMFKQLWLVVISWGLLLTGLLALPFSGLPLVAALLLQLLFLLRFMQKNRSLRYGLIGFINIHVSAAGMVRGLFRSQADPHAPIDAVCLKRGL